MPEKTKYNNDAEYQEIYTGINDQMTNRTFGYSLRVKDYVLLDRKRYVSPERLAQIKKDLAELKAENRYYPKTLGEREKIRVKNHVKNMEKQVARYS